MDNRKLTRHERHRQQTRQKLHAALLELILEKGYDAVSIQDITDRADLARATFYIHFKDKDELLWSVIANVIHTTEEEVQRGYSGVLPPQVEYYGYINIFMHVERYKDVYRVILSNKGSSEMHHRVHEYMVGETLNDIQRLNIYSDFQEPPEITAQVVVGSILSLAIWWLETPNEYTAQQMAAMLYHALHHREPPG